MTSVVVGTVLYSPKCSHLCNLQGLWSVPATWYSHPLHLQDRQNVQELAQHTVRPQERGSSQAPGRRKGGRQAGCLTQSLASVWSCKHEVTLVQNPLAVAVPHSKRRFSPSRLCGGLGETFVLKCGCTGELESSQTKRLLSALMAWSLHPWSCQRQAAMFPTRWPFA